MPKTEDPTTLLDAAHALSEAAALLVRAAYAADLANRRPTPLKTADDRNGGPSEATSENARTAPRFLEAALRSAFPDRFPPDAPVTPEGVAALGNWLAGVGKSIGDRDRRIGNQAETILRLAANFREAFVAYVPAESDVTPDLIRTVGLAVAAQDRDLEKLGVENAHLRNNEAMFGAALRRFPELADANPLTLDAIAEVARQHETMLRNWGPIPFAIEFQDQDGAARCIVFEAGESSTNINPGWVIPEDADWQAVSLDYVTEGFLKTDGGTRVITRRNSGNFWRFADDAPTPIAGPKAEPARAIEPEPEAVEPEETPGKPTSNECIVHKPFAQLTEDEKRELLSFDRLTFVNGTVLEKTPRGYWEYKSTGQGNEGTDFKDWFHALEPFEGGPK